MSTKSQMSSNSPVLSRHPTNAPTVGFADKYGALLSSSKQVHSPSNLRSTCPVLVSTTASGSGMRNPLSAIVALFVKWALLLPQGRSNWLRLFRPGQPTSIANDNCLQG